MTVQANQHLLGDILGIIGLTDPNQRPTVDAPITLTDERVERGFISTRRESRELIYRFVSRLEPSTGEFVHLPSLGYSVVRLALTQWRLPESDPGAPSRCDRKRLRARRGFQTGPAALGRGITSPSGAIIARDVPGVLSGPVEMEPSGTIFVNRFWTYDCVVREW
jgi:hypothetical protein